jgi:hypothetical protein
VNRLARAFGTPRRALFGAIAGSVILAIVLFQFAPLRTAVSWLVVLAPIVVLALKNRDETKRVMGWALGQFAWASQAVEREAVKQDLEGTLSQGAKRINAACGDAAVTKVVVTFLKSGEDVERLIDGTLVVGIAHHKDRIRNLVAAAWAFARNGVLPYARPHLDRDVSSAIDFVVTKDLLAAENHEAVARFLREIWTPAVADATRLRDLTAKLEALQQDQLLAPLVFSEFVELGHQMATRFPRDAVARESARFVDNLYAIARSEAEGDTRADLDFNGAVIKCMLILVAKPDVYATKGPSPYRRWIDRGIQRGYRSIYLLARGRNVAYARTVAVGYESHGRVVAIEEFNGSIRTDNGRILPRLVLRILTAQVGARADRRDHGELVAVEHVGSYSSLRDAL